MIIYGIPTCDTCRKARAALPAARFHDVRAEPLPAAEIARLHAHFGEKLLNRASTTWRALPEAERTHPVVELIAAHPTLMKRPVITDGGRLTLGWDKAAQAVWL